MKLKNLKVDWTRLFGIFLILEGMFSIAYSTDQIELFFFGRLLRILIGLLFLFGCLPQSFYKISGLYLVAEAVGSALYSPDQDLLFQAGRAVRIIFGFMLMLYERK